MLLWLKNDKKNLIRADLPRENNSYIQKLKQFDLKYQLHKCVPRRCFKNKKKIFNDCKYGFPFDICPDDHIFEDGSKYFYKRMKKQDQQIVQIKQYLVKYISKIEPTFSAKKLDNETNEIQKYFQLRTFNSIELLAFIMGHHFVQSNMKRKHELIYMDDDDDDIFKDSVYDHYLQWPYHSSFDSITIFDDFRKYEIFVKYSKTTIPISRSENVYLDRKNDIVIKRNKEIITRTNYFNSNDGEIFYFQKLLFS
ncbi:DNA helicase ATP, partial [Brachionus plicatilis]